jgi:serine/threonine protein kinase
MKADRWKQIDELFDAVLEIPGKQREVFLSEKCNGDDELKREVLSLLRAQKESDQFMENSAMNLMAKEIAYDQTTVVDFSIIGRELGNYRVERPIGAGGMGEVFLARDTKLNRKVALKILPAEFVLDAERVKRFEREAKAVSALNHPNIVTIYDFGQMDGINFIVTEYIEGKTVRELIKENLSLKDTLSIVSQTCEALDAAHASGIIHRDIKPENIMVRPDGYVKVLDFGLAKLNPQADSIHVSLTNYTQKGMIIGTLAYMSPAQISDEAVDHRTDLWSLGVVFYEMLTGANPFKGENRQATLNAILNVNPPPVSESVPSLPAELDRILEKALEKDADVSYQNASDIRADLRRVRREIDSSPSLRSGNSLPQKTAAPAPRKNYLFPAIAASVLIIAIASGVYFWRQSNNNQTTPSPWTNAVASQLTDFAGAENFPSISPDGKVLLFTRLVNGQSDIFWQRIGGSNPKNLTEDSPDDDTHPAFSPDGEQIAFRSSRNGGGIFVMGATGESVKRLTDFGFSPSWSPDGTEIIFSSVKFVSPISRDGDGVLWAVNVSDGGKRKIETGVDSIQPNVSPNGKRVVFWGRDGKFQRDLWTVPLGGGEVVRTTNDAALDWNPIWSPDGKHLYFCSNRNGGISVWRLAVDEETGKPLGEPETVIAPSAQSSMLTISRDGKNLIYVRAQRIENIQRVEFDPAKKQIIGKPTFITEGSKRARTVDVSPDGRQIVFYLTGEGQEDLVTIKIDDLKWNQITDDEARDRVPRFSPDGSRIAFYSTAGNGVYEIWTIKPDGSDRQKLSEYGGRGLKYPVWSPDNLRLAFSAINGGTQIIELKKSWAAQTPVILPPLNEKGDFFVAWNWSPDGKKIVGWRSDEFVGEYPGIYIYTFATNSYEKITENGFRPAWLADSRHLLACRDDKLFVVDSQTKTEREILSFLPQAIDTPAVTLDNRYIFYDLITDEGDIQMLSLK